MNYVYAECDLTKLIYFEYTSNVNSASGREKESKKW
jgi:hypothetical protein